MNFDIAAIITAAGTAIGVVIGALYKRNQNKQDQYQHEERLIELSKNLTESNKILKDFTSLSRDFEYIKEGMNKLHKEIQELKQEVNIVKTNSSTTDTMLLRREIYNLYWTYEKKKEIPERDFETALNLYTVYHSLGGNGTAEQYIEEIKTWNRI